MLRLTDNSLNPSSSCIVLIERIAGNQDEEIVTFGVSAWDTKSKAKQLLVDRYGCNDDEISQLLQQSQIEPLSHWYSPGNS